MPGIDLVRRHAEPALDDTAQERRRQEPVVAAEDEPRWHVGPGFERPGIARGCFGLTPSAPQCLGGEIRRYVLVEELDVVRVVLVHFIVIAGIGPLVRRGLSGSRNQPRDEHEESGLLSGTHERRRERAKRLRHHAQIGAIADGRDDGVGIVRKPGCVVLAREVGRHDILSAVAQVGLNKVPIPAHISGTMD